LTGDAPLDPIALVGVVVAVQANYYWVQLTGDRAALAVQARRLGLGADEPVPLRLLCLRRGRLKKIGQQVMVGDRVVVEEPDWQGQRGAIAQVLPRSSSLDRPPVANVDCILLVFSLAQPTLDPVQLGRFLVKAESTGVPVLLCLNKADLVDESTQEAWRSRLAGWGYRPILTSALTDPTLASLRSPLAGRTSVLCGPSGVGKSSTINRLIPAVDLRVAGVSGRLERGRHTTRHVELFELPGGGLLADTPGFNQPTLDCGPEALAACFPEIRDRLGRGQCYYGDCLHRDEPGCAVRGDWDRYGFYLTLLEEAIAYRDRQRSTTDGEATLKRKTRRDGQDTYEPRLESKRYRRISRRSRHQALDQTVEGIDWQKLETLETLDGDTEEIGDWVD
jgi:ribosome biogenesis GTPase